MGARDGPRVRRPVKVAEEHIERLKGMIHDAEQAEFLFTNNDRTFAGNSLQFMQACVKAEQLPVRIRLYAATRCIDFEREFIIDGTLDSILDNPELMAKFEEHRREAVIEHDAKLRLWVQAGKLTEEAALLVRGLWIQPDDPTWEPLPQPAPRQISYLPPAEKPIVLPKPAAPPPLNSSPWELPNPKLVQLYGTPFARWLLSGNREVQANQFGRVTVDERDAAELIGMGATPCSDG
jgi:hypothetical protein